MRETRVAPEHQDHRDGIHFKHLLRSFAVGLVVGILAGAPLGWFAHRFYSQQRAAQVLLCRQQNFGLRETELQARCGNLY